MAGGSEDGISGALPVTTKLAQPTPILKPSSHSRRGSRTPGVRFSATLVQEAGSEMSSLRKGRQDSDDADEPRLPPPTPPWHVGKETSDLIHRIVSLGDTPASGTPWLSSGGLDESDDESDSDDEAKQPSVSWNETTSPTTKEEETVEDTGTVVKKKQLKVWGLLASDLHYRMQCTCASCAPVAVEMVTCTPWCVSGATTSSHCKTEATCSPRRSVRIDRIPAP